MKKSEIIFSSMLVPIDYVLLVLAGMSAYFVRYSRGYTENIREVVFSLALVDYLKFVYIFAIIWIVIFAMSGLFSMRPQRKVFGLLNKVVLACSTGTLAVIVVFFFSRELFSSRFIILAVWIISIVYISIAHLLLRYIQRLAYRKGIGVHRMVLVGGDKTSRELVEEFSNTTKLGIEVAYVADHYGDELIAKIQELYKQGRRMNGEGVWVIEDKLKVVTYKDGYRKQSKHNTVPSQAIDVVSYPISWTDDNQAFYFSGHVMGIAKMMGINIRYGGDFNRNNQVSDEGFSDRYHFEIIED